MHRWGRMVGPEHHNGARGAEPPNPPDAESPLRGPPARASPRTPEVAPGSYSAPTASRDHSHLGGGFRSYLEDRDCREVPPAWGHRFGDSKDHNHRRLPS